jgi:hypothetical protein
MKKPLRKSSKGSFFLTSCALLCGLGLAARLSASPLVTVSAGDPVLDDIRYVAREAGVSILSFTPPLSRDEIKEIFAGVEIDNLPLPAQEAYGRIEARLNPSTRFSEGFFSLSFHAIVQAGAAFRSNTAIPWDSGDFQQPAFLHFPLDFYFADFVHLNLEPSINLEPTFNEADGHFLTNVPYQWERIDLFFPFRAFMSAGGKWWHFQIGRDQVSFGTAHTGNLLLSDTPDFYDFARLSLFSSHFKYSALVIQNPLVLSLPYYDPTTGEFQSDDQKKSIQRHIYIHRLDFKIFNKIAVGITEGLSVGNSPLEIRYLNPLIVFHNFTYGNDYDRWGSNRNMNNSIFSVEVNWTPAPAVALYAQIVIDEFTTPWEAESNSENGNPFGTGYLAGIEYSRAFDKWGACFYVEAVYTDPYLYVDNGPFAAFVWMRHTNRESMESRYRWMGHPEGRDAVVFAAGARFSKDDRLAFSGGLSFVIHGEHRIEWDWGYGDTYVAERTPTGTPEKRLAAVFGADWKPVPQVTLSLEADIGAVLNANNHADSNEFGVGAALSVKYVF